MHKEVTEEEELKVKQQKTVKNEFFFVKLGPMSISHIQILTQSQKQGITYKAIQIKQGPD